MGEKLKKEKKARTPKEPKPDAPSIGDNIDAIRAAAEPIFDKLDRINDQRESKIGEFMSDIKSVLDEGANDIGVPRAILREVYNEHRRKVKQAAKAKELEPSERDAMEALRDAMGLDTPFGEYAAKRLADA